MTSKSYLVIHTNKSNCKSHKTYPDNCMKFLTTTNNNPVCFSVSQIHNESNQAHVFKDSKLSRDCLFGSNLTKNKIMTAVVLLIR